MGQFEIHVEQRKPEKDDEGITSLIFFFLITAELPPPPLTLLFPSLPEWTRILLLLGYTPLPSAAAPEPCAM